MIEKEFMGHKYKSDGENVWKDGVLLDIRVPKGPESMEMVEALKVDDKLYYDNSLWIRLTPNQI